MQKTALVTGAARGIGGKIVETMLADGWDIWGLDLDPPEKPFTVPEGQRYRHILTDVTDPAAITAALKVVASETSALGAVICSAGVVRVGMLDSIAVEDVDLMYKVNLRGPWHTVQSALPLLRHGASTTDPSRVVVIGSAGGLRPKVGNGIYSAFKQALHTIANVMAVELGPSGITVNTLAPGTIDTRMPWKAAEDAKQNGANFGISGVSPLGRIGTTQDVANAVMFYLSEQSKYISGSVVPIDGGLQAAFFMGPAKT